MSIDEAVKTKRAKACVVVGNGRLLFKTHFLDAPVFVPIRGDEVSGFDLMKKRRDL